MLYKLSNNNSGNNIDEGSDPIDYHTPFSPSLTLLGIVIFKFKKQYIFYLFISTFIPYIAGKLKECEQLDAKCKRA